jgi:hypothetical protein
MATPAEEATRDRITWIAQGLVSNPEFMKGIYVTARQQSIGWDDAVIVHAIIIAAKIEAAFP